MPTQESPADQSDAVREELAARRLPDLLGSTSWASRRRTLVGLLAAEIYGPSPPPPARVHATAVRPEPIGDGAVRRHTVLGFETPSGWFEFPCDVVLPTGESPAPMVIHLAFERYPAIEGATPLDLVRRGWALAVLDYQDVARDADAPADGLAARFPREQWGWGRIGMWAYAASRVLDHVRELPGVDPDRVVVAGHSRLGKTALWAAAQDERFAAAVSNDSGCAGAALARGGTGESIADITRHFGHWFGPTYASWAGREHDAPFDQHMLIAALAPRPVYVASAEDDGWADPRGEFLAAAAAGAAWRSVGLPGLEPSDRLPRGDAVLHDGSVGYHQRPGGHDLTGVDWSRALDFLDRRLG